MRKDLSELELILPDAAGHPQESKGGTFPGQAQKGGNGGNHTDPDRENMR